MSVNPYSDEERHIELSGLRVYYQPQLDGGGMEFGQDYIAHIRASIGNVGRLFEWCCGPGFIGFSLLAQGLCKSLCLADVNPAATALCEKTIRFNNLGGRVAVYTSDGLSNIPDNEKWDLVVGNPPHSGDNKIYPGIGPQIIYQDIGWALHRRFFRDVQRHLNSNGKIILQECRKYSSAETFRPISEPEGLYVEDCISCSSGYDKYFVSFSTDKGGHGCHCADPQPDVESSYTVRLSTLRKLERTTRLFLCGPPYSGAGQLRIWLNRHPRILIDSNRCLVTRTAPEMFELFRRRSQELADSEIPTSLLTNARHQYTHLRMFLESQLAESAELSEKDVARLLYLGDESPMDSSNLNLLSFLYPGAAYICVWTDPRETVRAAWLGRSVQTNEPYEDFAKRWLCMIWPCYADAMLVGKQLLGPAFMILRFADIKHMETKRRINDFLKLNSSRELLECCDVEIMPDKVGNAGAWDSISRKLNEECAPLFEKQLALLNNASASIR